MSRLTNTLSRKLTAMNMLVSAGALILASMAFFAYDLITVRENLVSNTSIQAQIIGSNAVSPLIFNDSRSAENTLSALRASPHIVYAGIYTANGNFFAGYRREPTTGSVPLPAFTPGETERSWFEREAFGLIQTVRFENKPVGIVYIRSDLGAITDRFKSYTVMLLTILGLSLAAALILSRLSQRVVSQPILRLADTARLVSREKDYALRVPEPKDHDEVALLVAAFNDMLTEIQRRDMALQEREQQFRTLADSIPQLAWMAEPNGDRSWYNQRWYEYTGATTEDVAGKGWHKWHDPAVLPEVIERWDLSLSSGEPFEMTYPLRGADGTFRHFLTRAVPVRDAKGKIVRWFGTNTDVTEQRRAEEALRQSEKLAATGRLAASIAHEINNPLEAVTNLVYLSLRQPANVQKYLQMADHELDRIAQITKNTLGFYRESAQPVEVDISAVLEEVSSLYIRKLDFKGINLHREFGSELKITGHPGEIRQIFANLIANAIEALPENGTLAIRASKARAINGRDRTGVRITFVDNGSGINSSVRRRIFEPFYTTKKDTGTGLGLWLTLGLVEKHHGSLRLRSSVRPGKSWTAFSVFLPANMESTKIV